MGLWRRLAGRMGGVCQELMRIWCMGLASEEC